MVALNKFSGQIPPPKSLSIADMAAKGKAMMSTPTKATSTSLSAACTFFGFGGELEWITPDVLSLIYVDLLRVYSPECGGTQEEYDKLREYKRVLDTIAR